MPKRKNEDAGRKKPAKKRPSRKTEELRAAYEWAKANFSAADLQKYTVDEPMYRMADVIAELERLQKRRKRKGA